MSKKNNRDYWPTYNWRVSKPSDQGMNTETLLNAFKNIQSNNDAFNSIIIIKNGYIVAEGYFHPFNKDYPRHIYCITKTVLATLIGILLKEGKLQNINQKVIEFFDPKKVANLCTYKSEMTIKDLLTSASGLDWGDTEFETKANLEIIGEMYPSTNEWGNFSFNRKINYKPGTFFNVSSAGPQLLAYIIKKVTGMSPHNYAKEKLFKPLGIKNTSWYQSSSDENGGGQGLSMTPRDVAKLGLLYLSNGYWEDNLILNSDFIKDASSVQVDSRDVHKQDNIIGHGYHWFILTGLPYNTYYMYGYRGQALFVVKELDLACVTASNLPVDVHKKKLYDLFKNYVLASCVNFEKNKNDAQIDNEFHDLLYTIEHPEPKKVDNLNETFIRAIDEIKYYFDQENTFIFAENLFNKLYVKTLMFKFINKKACRLEIITYCDHYFNIMVSLDGTFSTTKVSTVYEEMSISAQGIFDSDKTLTIVYHTNHGMTNFIKVVSINKRSIDCNVSTHFTQGSKKGYA